MIRKNPFLYGTMVYTVGYIINQEVKEVTTTLIQ